jgi:hypothetical protein
MPNATLAPPGRIPNATPTVPPARMPNAKPPAPPHDGGDDDVAALERAARALARASGCHAAADCRVAPLGAKACGGPRTFVEYCRTSTDSSALARALDRLAVAERAYNERTHVMSSCQLAVPPIPAWTGGRCTTGQR